MGQIDRILSPAGPLWPEYGNFICSPWLLSYFYASQISVIIRSQEKTSRSARFLLGAGMAACILLNYHNLFLDFWCDEIPTIRRYLLVPLHTTVTDYRNVNNHIGFSLLANLYLKLTGQDDLLTLLWNPERLRMIGLLFSCGSVWMLWRLSLDLGGTRLALINIVLLLTTVPFYNYTLQLRGYGLAIFFVLLLLRHLYGYYDQRRWQHAAWAAVAMACALYTQPATAYLAVALFPGIAVFGLLSAGYSRKEQVGFVLRGWLIIAAGAALAYLLYLPATRSSVQDNIMFGAKREARFFYDVFAYNTYYFLSARYLALTAAALGVWLWYRRHKRTTPQFAFFCCCLLSYVGCYLVAFARGDAPVVRIYMPEVPLFILPLGMGIYWLDGALAPRYRAMILVTVLASCMLTFPLQLIKRNRVIAQNVLNSTHSENLFTDWHMHQYAPVAIMNTLLKHQKDGGPLIVCVSWYNHDELDYLQAMGVRYYHCGEEDSVTTGLSHWLIITSNREMLRRSSAALRFTKLNDGLYPNNLYRVSRSELPPPPDK